MTGALRRDAGEIRLDGRPVEIDTPGQAARAGHRRRLPGSQSRPDDVGDQEPDARPPAAALRPDFVARGRRAGAGRGLSASRRHRRRAPARLLFRRGPATRRHRPRARRRHAGAGARRADRQPRRQRDRAAVPDHARPEVRAASRSSSSPISSTRFTRSPTASRCCATVGWSAPLRPRKCRRSKLISLMLGPRAASGPRSGSPRAAPPPKGAPVLVARRRGTAADHGAVRSRSARRRGGRALPACSGRGGPKSPS